ncbi:MAG: hypothetical protein HY288_11805 [Planctomycetia bacterium]|nr:hypothetical protein [Planctomycetia bacterium]
MSNRERWTVYPLLFLTLGIVLKDKLTKFVTTDVVVCKTLVVTDRDRNERVVVSSTAAGGLVKAESSNHRVNVLLGHTDKVVGLMFTDGNNNLLQPSFKVRPPASQPPSSDQNSKARPGMPPVDPENQQPAEENQDATSPFQEERAK